uniref:Chitin-binding type-2 domain-containing protein n=1 Tax=Anopheles maculatus TaxID=74869 RepID=A0A182TBX8_9DIPT
MNEDFLRYVISITEKDPDVYLDLISFLAVAHVATCAVIQQRNEPICLEDDDFFAPGDECYNFYQCRYGMLELLECPGDLLWDNDELRCREGVECENEQTTIPTEEPTTETPTLPPTTTTEAATAPPITEAPTLPPTTTTETQSSTFMPETEGALPILYPGSECPPDIRAFMLHATDCQRYSYCLYGIEYPQICPFLETFNLFVGHCVPRDPNFCFPGSQ